MKNDQIKVGEVIKLGPDSTAFKVITLSERFVLLQIQRGGCLELSKLEYQYLKNLLYKCPEYLK